MNGISANAVWKKMLKFGYLTMMAMPLLMDLFNALSLHGWIECNHLPNWNLPPPLIWRLQNHYSFVLYHCPFHVLFILSFTFYSFKVKIQVLEESCRDYKAYLTSRSNWLELVLEHLINDEAMWYVTKVEGMNRDLFLVFLLRFEQQRIRKQFFFLKKKGFGCGFYYNHDLFTDLLTAIPIAAYNHKFFTFPFASLH